MQSGLYIYSRYACEIMLQFLICQTADYVIRSMYIRSLSFPLALSAMLLVLPPFTVVSHSNDSGGGTDSALPPRSSTATLVPKVQKGPIRAYCPVLRLSW